MKQKIILLLVLIAGLTACSKDDGDDYMSDKNALAYNNAPDSFSQIGEFEGYWILKNKKIETDTLTVFQQTIIVPIPSEPLLEYIVRAIPNSIDGMRYDISPNLRYIFLYGPQGYSENKSYSNLYNMYDGFSSLIAPTTYLVANGTMYYDTGNNEEAIYGYYYISTDLPMLAIFDKDTLLWTLKITMNKVRYIKNGETNEEIMDLLTPLELFFVTTKKIKDIKPE